MLILRIHPVHYTVYPEAVAITCRVGVAVSLLCTIAELMHTAYLQAELRRHVSLVKASAVCVTVLTENVAQQHLYGGGFAVMKKADGHKCIQKFFKCFSRHIQFIVGRFRDLRIGNTVFQVTGKIAVFLIQLRGKRYIAAAVPVQKIIDVTLARIFFEAFRDRCDICLQRLKIIFD